jgi:hypothetical protein
MSRDGNGTFNLPTGNPVSPGTTIESSWANLTMGEVATALSNSIAADGQTPIVNNLPMSGKRHTGVGNPTAQDQYLTLLTQQQGIASQLTDVTGTNDVKGNMLGSPTQYGQGMIVTFVAAGTNTGPATLQVGNLAVKSLLEADGSALEAGDLQAGKFYMAFYVGGATNAFTLLTTVVTPESVAWVAANTGEVRPVGGTYDPITINSIPSRIINIPAGSAVVSQPESNGGSKTVTVTWAATTITLPVGISAATFSVVGMKVSGLVATPVSFQAYPTTVDYTDTIIVGIVNHPAGTITTVSPARSIAYSDNYRSLSNAALRTGSINNGMVITGTSATAIAMSAGAIFVMGASSGTTNAPDLLSVSAIATAAPFYTIKAGNTLSGSTFTSITTVDGAQAVRAQYNNAGVQTVVAAGEATIHRIYWSAGALYWVYGTRLYANFALAKSELELDRSLWTIPTLMVNATLLCEVIMTGAGVANDVTSCIFVPKSVNALSILAAIGSDAASDGQYWGRRNGNWEVVVGAANAAFNSVDPNITKADARFVAYDSNASLTAGTSGFLAKKLLNNRNWMQLSVQGNAQQGSILLQGYSPNTGTLSSTWTFDVQTGATTFPAGSAVSGTGAATFGSVAATTSVTSATSSTTGAASHGGTLTVSAGGANITGTVTVTGPVNVSDTIYVSGHATVNSLTTNALTQVTFGVGGGPINFTISTFTAIPGSGYADGYTITVEFPGTTNTTNNPTLAINGGTAYNIVTGKVAGMLVVAGGLVGTQRLRFSTVVNGWVAIDQLSHYITTSLASNQTMLPGHTFVYDMNSVSSLAMRVSVKDSQSYALNLNSMIKSSSVAGSLLLTVTGITTAGWSAFFTPAVISGLQPLTWQSYQQPMVASTGLLTGAGTGSASQWLGSTRSIVDIWRGGSSVSLNGTITTTDSTFFPVATATQTSQASGGTPTAFSALTCSGGQLWSGVVTLTRIS